MTNPFRMGGFEKRLLVFFLLLSVTPTVLIAFFGARYLMQSVERFSSPALRESFSNSMEIARKLSTKLEGDAASTSVQLADEAGRHRRPLAPELLVNLMASVAGRSGADFTALYIMEGSAWRLAHIHPRATARIDTLLTLDMVPPVAEPSKIIFADEDIIASGRLYRTDSLFVAGFILEPGMMEMMRGTGEDLSRYSSMSLYVRVLRRYMIVFISALAVIMIAASAIVSRVLAGRMSHPIHELAAATERIARGDLDHRVQVKARDEIQSLVTAFNNMTQDLQEYKRNLIRAERIAAWRDVARRIAHEIKNPLTPIEIALYRLKKRLGGDREGGEGREDRQDGKVRGAGVAADTDVIAECLDSILREVSALKAIAQEFSAFAKMPEPRLASLDVNQTLQSVLGLYASSFENIRLETAYAPGLPAVRGDDDQVRRVLSNLIKNAVEAMPQGGRLTVATTLCAPDLPGNQTAVRIEIADTGPGIPVEIGEKIFDPYFTTKSSGTGLGLAMAYRIIQDHGGTIGFESSSSGTTFIVELPVAGEDREAAS